MVRCSSSQLERHPASSHMRVIWWTPGVMLCRVCSPGPRECCLASASRQDRQVVVSLSFHPPDCKHRAKIENRCFLIAKHGLTRGAAEDLTRRTSSRCLCDARTTPRIRRKTTTEIARCSLHAGARMTSDTTRRDAGDNVAACFVKQI
jgi:hypothetical protein